MAGLFSLLTHQLRHQNPNRQRQSIARRLLSHLTHLADTTGERSFLTPPHEHRVFSRQAQPQSSRFRQRLDRKKLSVLAFYSSGVSAVMKRVSIRSRVLLAVDKLHKKQQIPITAKSIAVTAGIDYRQCLNALNALHESERIFRVGKKKSATWLPMSCELATKSAPIELERTLNALCAAVISSGSGHSRYRHG